MTIVVRYTAIDHYRQTRRFATLAGARRYAHRMVGPHPEISETFQYAVSSDGVGKVTADGVLLAELFPAPPSAPARSWEDIVEYAPMSPPSPAPVERWKPRASKADVTGIKEGH